LGRYHGGKRFLEENERYLDLRRLGLLEWIYNSERSMIELIIIKKIKERRNYHEAIQNYVENKRGTRNRTEVNSYMKERSNIEKIKFNNFNLFTQVKKRHLGSDTCVFEFNRRGVNQPFEQSRNFVNKSYNDFYLDFGIQELSFLQDLERTNPQKSSMIYHALKNLFNLYLIPIQNDDSKVLRVSRDIILMGITFILFNDDYDLKKIPEKKKVGEGAYGQIKLLIDGKIGKYENLRASVKEFSTAPGEKPYYPAQSYVASMSLISLIIQKYLYRLNNQYVPYIYDLRFNFESKKSLTPTNKSLNLKSEITMNFVGINLIQRSEEFMTENLHDIIFTKKYYKDPNFVLFVLKIIQKLCIILDFYQKKCLFVHMDLHAKNVMVNFKYNNAIMDIEDFQVKLIDFSFSSIVVKNSNNDLSMMVYINYRPMKDPNITNPYINQEWNQQDLKYFFMALILYYSNPFFKEYTLNRNSQRKIDEIIKIFLSIFQIQDGYLERWNDLIREEYSFCYKEGARRVFEVFLKKNIHRQIYGSDFQHSFYIPRILNEKLREVIESIEVK
jgi:hypothetical protein